MKIIGIEDRGTWKEFIVVALILAVVALAIFAVIGTLLRGIASSDPGYQVENLGPVKVWHDEARGVTCWYMDRALGVKNAAIDCWPDHMLKGE